MPDKKNEGGITGYGSYIEKSERAAGIEPTPASTPPLPSTLKEGTLYPLSSIPRKRLMDRSTEGSPPFSKSELKQGYRKMGKGLKGK